jgi:hypothetical protein
MPVIERLLFCSKGLGIALNSPRPLVKNYYAYGLVFVVVDDSSDHERILL